MKSIILLDAFPLLKEFIAGVNWCMLHTIHVVIFFFKLLMSLKIKKRLMYILCYQIAVSYPIPHSSQFVHCLSCGSSCVSFGD